MFPTKIIPCKYKRMSVKDISDEGCVNILDTFLTQLGREFRTKYFYLKDNPNDDITKESFEDLKNFMRSDYFNMITNLIGEEVIESLQKKCEREYLGAI